MSSTWSLSVAGQTFDVGGQVGEWTGEELSKVLLVDGSQLTITYGILFDLDGR
jgi:hypothetical protein